jgi:hypothetical protein
LRSYHIKETGEVGLVRALVRVVGWGAGAEDKEHGLGRRDDETATATATPRASCEYHCDGAKVGVKAKAGYGRNVCIFSFVLLKGGFVC